MKKQYIGDGVYAEITHGDLVLTTEDGISITNTIVLEGEVWRAVIRYVERSEHRD